MNRKVKALFFGGITLVLLAACTPARTTEPTAPTSHPAEIAAPAEPTQEQAPAPEETPPAIDLPADSASELWSDDESLHRIKPLDVPLDAAAQWQIYSACGFDVSDFCLLMAIGYHETGLDPTAIGDNGGSWGLFQINVKWHRDRMKRLDVTDLQDPAQSAAVALDYLKELEGRYGFEPGSECLLIAYNAGPSGARKLIDKGVTSTNYSKEVIALYRKYMTEMEGSNG